jgi:energy-converting hydrogenase Eha subunit B
MIVLVGVAIYGAVLGLSIRPALRAILVAVVSVGAVQYSAIWLSHLLQASPGLAGVVATLQTYAGVDARNLAPLTLATALASAVSALFAAITQSSERRRRVRRLAAIEE